MSNFAEWEKQGVEIAVADKSQKWALADWLAVGDTVWGGTAYDTAQRHFPHYSRKYLMTVAYVARHVTLPFRKEKLSFAHHECVAALPPDAQLRWLSDAETAPYTVAQLKREIAKGDASCPFSVKFPDALFSELENLSRLSGISPEVLVMRAVRLFIAHPPADIETEVQKAAVAHKEKERLAAIREQELRAAAVVWRQEQALRKSACDTESAELLNSGTSRHQELRKEVERLQPMKDSGVAVLVDRLNSFRSSLPYKEADFATVAEIRGLVTEFLESESAVSAWFPDDEPRFATAIVEGDADWDAAMSAPAPMPDVVEEGVTA